MLSCLRNVLAGLGEDSVGDKFARNHACLEKPGSFADVLERGTNEQQAGAADESGESGQGCWRILRRTVEPRTYFT